MLRAGKKYRDHGSIPLSLPLTTPRTGIRRIRIDAAEISTACASLCVCVCVCTSDSRVVNTPTFDSPTFGVACVTFSCVCIFPTEAARPGARLSRSRRWHATNVKNLLDGIPARHATDVRDRKRDRGGTTPGMANEELTFDETADDEMVETTN